jgi:hypothetical protein
MLDLAVERLEDGTSRAIAVEELIELRALVAQLESRPGLEAVVWASPQASPLVRLRLKVCGFTLGAAEVPAAAWPKLRTMFERGGFVVVDDELLASAVSVAAE